MLLLCGGLFLEEVTRTHPIPAAQIGADSGRAYLVGDLGLSANADLRGDDNDHPGRSPLSVLEDGRVLGPGHAVHEDIRRLGGGRYSHWGKGLFFSASDNSDPRSNGRSYKVAHEVEVPGWIRWLAAVGGALAVLYAQRRGIAREFHDTTSLARQAAARVHRPDRKWPWVHMGLFGVLFALIVFLGVERSAWILITQPVEDSHAANSMLGFSFIQDVQVLHKENHSSFNQVALFSGFEFAPDFYFRRPVYTFIATVISPVLGVAASLFLVNLVAWVAAVWLCHRFASRFYGDERAGWWAALLAIAGIGFVVHARDLSAHLLAFTIYMGGVVLIYESGAWRGKVELRKHLVIGLYLVLACLQYNTGIALVAAYLTVAIPHQPAAVIAASIGALASQPAWGWVIGEIYRLKDGVPLPDLSATERAYLSASLLRWWGMFELPPAQALSWFGSIVVSFLTFEAPLVVLVGALALLADLWRGSAGRSRLMFAIPFIVLPVAAGAVFAPVASARGYLVYGMSIFFFASCGAAVVALGRRRAASLALGIVLVATTVIWSAAHFANVLGPSKAFFMGMHRGQHLLVPGGWEAVSLTGAEPTPRLFGGSARLREAGLTSSLPATPRPKYRGAWQAFSASVMFGVLAWALLVAATRLGWRTALVAAAALVAVPTWGGRWIDHRTSISIPERIHQVVPTARLTYEVAMSPGVQMRLVEGLRRGNVVTLFPAYHTGSLPPSVRIGERVVRLVRKIDAMNWLLDSTDLLLALEGGGDVRMATTFPGAEDSFIGGWQRIGLPGRRVQGDAPPALPAVELRMLRDLESKALLLVAF